MSNYQNLCQDDCAELPKNALPSNALVRFGLQPAWAKNLLKALLIWCQRSRERFELESLTDDQLKDAGISRSEVEREIKKSFWVR